MPGFTTGDIGGCCCEGPPACPCPPAIRVTGRPDGTPPPRAVVTVTRAGSDLTCAVRDCPCFAQDFGEGLACCRTCLLVEPGPCEVTISHDDYRDWSGVLDLQCDGTVSVEMVPLTQATPTAT